jgi:outer membrane receptor for ferrienterochelin and colicin
VLLGLLALPSAAGAQAVIEVTVFNQQTQDPVAGAEVVLENTQTQYTARARSDERGKARFPALSTAGSYTVKASSGDAFYESKAEGVVLRSNFDRSVTLSLVPRARTSEEITVSASNSVAEVNAVNAEVSASLGEREIEGLPIEGRDITRALYRLPNVTQATGFYPEAPNVSVNGANGLYANYMVDGLDNNENFLGGQKFAAPVGIVQEVTVLTSNYSAEFGRTGNGVFNITTRSGANDLRGEAFYLTRPGPSMDSASPFAQLDLSGNQVKDGFARHQGGFALGGPVRKDRTFYYLNAEYTRDKKDNLLNVPELGVNETVTGHNKFLYTSAKLDHRWNDRWGSSLRANVGRVTVERQGGGLDGGVTFPSAGNFQDRNSVLAAFRTHHVGTSHVSETSVQYSRFRWNYGRAENVDDPQAFVLGAAGTPVAVLGHPGYLFDDVENTWQAQQKVTLHRDRHTLKFGADVISADFALTGGGNPSGNYTVQLTSAQEAALRGVGRGAALGVRDLPANVRVVDYNVELHPASFGTRQNLFALYAEDLIAVSSRLNLTIGLRWDYDSLSKGGADTGDLNNVAPRLAVNYQLGDGSVIRGGYGMFYEKNLYAIYSDALQQNSTAAGFRSQLQRLIDLGILPGDTDLDRVTFDGNLGASASGVTYLNGPRPADLQANRASIISGERRILNPEGYDNPRTQHFALGYQRQLGPHHLFYADLFHARSSNLPRLRDLNAPAPYPIDPARVVVRTEAQANATRPVGVVAGGARTIVVTENGGISRYAAATLNLVRAAGGGRFGYRGSYTLSRLRNDTEDINFRAQDANDFAADYGPSINDRRHVVNAVGWFYPVRELTVSLALLAQSGQPINRIPDARIFGTTDLNGDGRSFADAYTGNSDRFPGAARNGDRLPWAYTVDLGAGYGVPLAGNRLELRADVFNLTNRTNLSGFSNNATQSNQIQVGPEGGPVVKRNAAPPRQFQFGVRYVF